MIWVIMRLREIGSDLWGFCFFFLLLLLLYEYILHRSCFLLLALLVVVCGWMAVRPCDSSILPKDITYTAKEETSGRRGIERGGGEWHRCWKWPPRGQKVKPCGVYSLIFIMYIYMTHVAGMKWMARPSHYDMDMGIWFYTTVWGFMLCMGMCYTYRQTHKTHEAHEGIASFHILSVSVFVDVPWFSFGSQTFTYSSARPCVFLHPKSARFQFHRNTHRFETFAYFISNKYKMGKMTWAGRIVFFFFWCLVFGDAGKSYTIKGLVLNLCSFMIW